MKQESIVVREWSSGRVALGRIIISARDISPSGCEVVIGYPGMPNVVKTMKVGDAVLYESTQDGIIEVRSTRLGLNEVEFLVTQVSPRPGFLAGAVEGDLSNAPFNEMELGQVVQSIAEIKIELQARKDIAPEQLELIDCKLDEIQAAARRMGRKDWINYVAGALTATCIAAAFAPEVTKGLFLAVNSAFAWLFENGPMVLQGL